MVDCLRISQVCTEKYWKNRPWQNGWIFLCQDCCTMVFCLTAVAACTCVKWLQQLFSQVPEPLPTPTWSDLPPSVTARLAFATVLATHHAAHLALVTVVARRVAHGVAHVVAHTALSNALAHTKGLAHA